MYKDFVCSLKCGLPVGGDLSRIMIHGARERNLKNICLEIPKGKLVALTGPSGSGKSSIAIGVLQKECLRQYLESLGMTTDHIPKAMVDHIIGLSPSIGVSQRVTDFNPRSTVGTKSGILTILRNLFAAIGHQPCSGCGKIVKQPLQDMGKFSSIVVEDERINSSSKMKTKIYFDCSHCGKQLEKLKMAHFSFNATSGACENCKGLGEVIEVDIPNLLDEEKTIKFGGVKFWDPAIASHYIRVIEAASRYYKFPFDPHIPIRNYTKDQKNFLLYGIEFPDFVKAHKGVKAPKKVSEGRFEGIVPYLLSRYKSNLVNLPNAIKKYIVHHMCQTCRNARLGKIGRDVTVCGKSMIEVMKLDLCELLTWINALNQHLEEEELRTFEAFSCALIARISNLIEVGLGYLTLDRALPSLSAGESQRLRLANLLASGLTGVLYVLDEPTAGLHPHDTAKLLNTLYRIKEAGNTVLVIEHDLNVIEKADYIIDVGPGGGSQGGKIVCAGKPSEVMNCASSLTGKYLARITSAKRSPTFKKQGGTLTIRGACEHNLKGIDVSIPINQLVVLTGVSGSGKSTFLFGILDKVARNHCHHAHLVPGKHESVQGLNYFHRVVTIDQATVSQARSSRSNVATYTKLFDLIRDLFSSLSEAKERELGAEKFSFNASDKRCGNCNGAGVVNIDMAFMPDVEAECPACNGMRFQEEVLSVKFNGYHIVDILNLTVNDAIAFFKEQPNILIFLNLMKEVGLGYLTLGQSTSTLSGGEAQRIKLAAELSKGGKESTLYLLDEPTCGLHPQEVERLLDILKRLVLKGHTVVAIEHHLEVICQADTIIDFGPEGGHGGGKIIAIGTPQELAENKESLTGQCVKEYLENNLN